MRGCADCLWQAACCACAVAHLHLMNRCLCCTVMARSYIEATYVSDLIEGAEAGSGRRLNVAPNSPKSIFVGRVGLWAGATPVLPSYCDEACVYVRILCGMWYVICVDRLCIACFKISSHPSRVCGPVRARSSAHSQLFMLCIYIHVSLHACVCCVVAGIIVGRCSEHRWLVLGFVWRLIHVCTISFSCLDCSD